MTQAELRVIVRAAQIPSSWEAGWLAGASFVLESAVIDNPKLEAWAADRRASLVRFANKTLFDGRLMVPAPASRQAPPETSRRTPNSTRPAQARHQAAGVG